MESQTRSFSSMFFMSPPTSSINANTLITCLLMLTEYFVFKARVYDMSQQTCMHIKILIPWFYSHTKLIPLNIVRYNE